MRLMGVQLTRAASRRDELFGGVSAGPRLVLYRAAEIYGRRPLVRK